MTDDAERAHTLPRVAACPPWCELAEGSPRHDRSGGTGLVHEKVMGSMALAAPHGGHEEVWIGLRQHEAADGTRQPPLLVIARICDDGIAEVQTGDATAVRGLSRQLAEAADDLDDAH
jgi:hypothetical protein